MLGVGFPLAVTAGFFAAMASVFSKLAFEDKGATLRHLTCFFLTESLCANVSILPSLGGDRLATNVDAHTYCAFLLTGCATSEGCLLPTASTEQCIYVDTVCKGSAGLWFYGGSSCGQ